jgi:chromosomal replication initiation ATPase DnaA
VTAIAIRASTCLAQAEDGLRIQHHATTLTRKLSPVNDERVTDICECVLDILSALFNVSGRELRQPGRTSTSVSRVRQIGMYVTHVNMGLSMAEVGRGFGRDRTTVMHACHLIEDMRDDAEFDQIVRMTERITAIAFRQQLGTLE